MSFLHQYAWLGAAAFVPALLLLLAGAGWRKLAKGLTVSLGLPLLVTALVAYSVLKVNPTWIRGDGSAGDFVRFTFLFLGCAVIFLVLGVITLCWQVSRPAISERTRRSRLILVFGGLAALLTALFGADRFIGATPAIASAERLIDELIWRSLYPHTGAVAPYAVELLRRDSLAVPAIVAELHRHPWRRSTTDQGIDLVLLKTLFQIDDPAALAEIRRWTGRDAPAWIRVMAINALATRGDQSILPLIVENLREIRGKNHRDEYAQLFHALGALKAADHIVMIRFALMGDPIDTAWNIGPAVSALTAIDTNEAWGLIAELAALRDAHLSNNALGALARSANPQTMALLREMLGDIDPARAHGAYLILQRFHPPLAEIGSWNEVNARRMREALRAKAAEAN
jgi:hypothetical protein